MFRSISITFLSISIELFLMSAVVNGQMPDKKEKDKYKTIIPSPSGPFVVGRSHFYWKDTARPEPFSSFEMAKREIMVYAYYPAKTRSNAATATYIPYVLETEKAMGTAKMIGEFGDAYPFIKSGQLNTHCFQNAELSRARNMYPILIFSHGFSETGFVYSSILEELASHGYIVFSIEHPYDAYAATLPDGRVIPFASEKWEAAMKAEGGAAKYQVEQIPVRAADVLFVIKNLALLNNGNLKSIFTSHLDMDKIGVFGHSLGGMTASRVCQLSNQVKACMNQDAVFRGSPYIEYSSKDSIQQPFLFFASQHSLYVTKNITPPSDEDLTKMKLTRQYYDSLRNVYQNKQDETLSKMSGGSYRISIETKGFVHRSFIDTKLFENSNDTAILFRNLKYIKMIRAYTLAFFDKYLKGMNAPLLDSAATINPDVTIDKFSVHQPQR